MTTHTGKGVVRFGCACILLAMLSGCAWFRYPAVPGAEGPSAETAAADSLEGLPRPEVQSMVFGGPSPADSSASPDSLRGGLDLTPAPLDSAATADSTRTGSEDGPASPDAGGAPAVGAGPSAAGSDTLGAGPTASVSDSLGAGMAGADVDSTAIEVAGTPGVDVDSTGAAPDSLGAPPPDALEGPDLWKLDGEQLSSVTGVRGQVIRITRPHITHGELIIDAPQGDYWVDSRRAVMTGGVAFEEGETRGTSLTAEYLRDTGTLHADGEVRIYSAADSLNLDSDHARYDRQEQTLYLAGNVRGRRGSRRLASSEAEWYRERREVLLLGSVRVTDPEDETRVTGERLLYDLETDRARVEEKPRLVLSGGEGAAIDISGRRLWMEPNGNAHAAGNVRVIRGGVTALADSAAFFRDRWKAMLLGAPTVYERDGTLTGDTLILSFDEDRVLHRADVHGHASVRFSPQDSLRIGERSTVQGDSLTMYFVDGETDRVEVFGNASSTYAPASSDSSSGVGTNAAEGDTITIFLTEGEVDRVRITGGAKGVYTFGAEPAAPDTAAPGVRSLLPPDSTAAPGVRTLLSPDSTAVIPVPGVTGLVDTTGVPGMAGVADSTGLPGMAGVVDTTGVPGTTAPDTLRLGGDPPPELVAREKVAYEADEVVFIMADRVVDLLGNCTVDYGPLTLKAGKVRFHTDRKYLEAEDEPVLVEHESGGGGDRTVVGDHMDYSLGSREGTISEGRTKAEDGHIFSDRLRRIGNDEFMARQGSYTTCDNIEHDADPHFHFTSKRMRIYLKDKVVAKPVTLYIRNIPIFALPFYVFSVRKGRQSGLLTPDIDFGLTSSSGRYFRNLGYYWAASEYYDFTFATEYREKTRTQASRFVGSLNTRYKKRYLMEGYLNLSQTLGSAQSQHDIVGQHKMSLGEWSVTGRAEFRDAEFRQESTLGTDFGYRLDRELKSDLNLSRKIGGGTLYLKASQRRDLAAEPDDGVDDVIFEQTLPSYSISLPTINLGRLPDRDGEGGRLPFLASARLSFSSSGSASRTERETTDIITNEDASADTLYGVEKESRTAATHKLSLSDSRRLFGALNLQPAFFLNEFWVDREYGAEDTTMAFRRAATWSASLTASTKLYGTFGGLGPVASVRHTMEPSASFNYQPEFAGLSYVDTSGVKQNRFRGVSAFEQQVMGLRLRNGFQAKVRSGEEVRRVDLLSWSLSSGFDFLAKDRGAEGWRDVNSNLDLTRILGVDLSFNSNHDPYRQFRFQDYQARALFGFNGVLPGYEPQAPTEEAFLEDEDELAGGAWGRNEPARGAQGAARDEALTWNAGFSVSQNGFRSGDDLESTAKINGDFNLQVTKNWSLGYSGNWDVTEGELAGETIRLRRDLHCWEASFTRSRLGDDTTFYFRINVKTMPDIKYEQGQRGGSGLSSFTGMLP